MWWKIGILVCIVVVDLFLYAAIWAGARADGMKERLSERWREEKAKRGRDGSVGEEDE